MKVVYIKPIDDGHIKILPMEGIRFAHISGWFGPYLEIPTQS